MRSSTGRSCLVLFTLTDVFTELIQNNLLKFNMWKIYQLYHLNAPVDEGCCRWCGCPQNPFREPIIEGSPFELITTFSQQVQTDEDPAPLLVSSSISSKVDPPAWHTRLTEQQPLLHCCQVSVGSSCPRWFLLTVPLTSQWEADWGWRGSLTGWRGGGRSVTGFQRGCTGFGSAAG